MKNKQALTVTELQLDGTFVSTVFDFFFHDLNTINSCCRATCNAYSSMPSLDSSVVNRKPCKE